MIVPIPEKWGISIHTFIFAESLKHGPFEKSLLFPRQTTPVPLR